MKQLPDGASIENWTSVTIRFLDPEAGIVIDIPAEPSAPARVRMDHEKVEGYKYITKTFFGEHDNLPPPRDNVFLVVSNVIKSLYPERDDLVVPNRIIRNGGGAVACQGFAI
jgi:hypothetical protein